MRIYYFGELIEDTNKTKLQSTEQISLDFDRAEEIKTQKDPIGDLLKELDLSIDIWRPVSARG